MQCPRCRHENPARAKFCLECGARVAGACAQCGTELPAGAKFCLECGTPADGRGAEGTRFASPETYTPRRLAEKILTSRSSLEGERKQVTILFADMKGSMELMADRDPEDARKLLDPLLELMMEAVHRYEGTVNQIMGDGIMALFGAPVALEDHGVRACYAALAMQEAVKRYAEGVRRREGVLPQIRVGLNSGEVVVRSIGSDLRMDYTAVGQTTHLAARMEQMAAAGSILASADTMRLAEGHVLASPLGPVAVKGLTTPVEAYEVTGAGPGRSRLRAAAARGLTRFVGRDPEMEAIERALEQAEAGRGQLVAVVGEPGVGKSRLYWEFTHSPRVRTRWLVLEAGSVSYGKATAYLPVIDLLKAYFQIGDRDDRRSVREKALGKLLALDRGLEPLLPALLALLDVAVDDPQWQQLDPMRRRERTRDAVRTLLLRESREQPLLVVFEDLHWIDGETQAFLDQLVESLPQARVLLLVNYRPEYRHGWSARTHYSQHRIDPLRPASAQALLAELLGDDRSLAPVSRLLLERTEGNPLFLEESVRTLVEEGALTGEPGAYRLARPAEVLHIPATVQAILAARIDRLPPDDKRLLQAAAAIGKDVPFALLEAIAEEPGERLREGLARLQTAEFLYEASLFPDLEYTFKHALTHEVTYASLLHERRRGLHARIAGAIETAWAGRLGDQVERLAHHASRGELWDKAVGYFEQAAVKSFGRSAHREASAFWKQALEALRHLPETTETRRQAIDMRISLRNSLFPLGQLDQISAVLDEAETLASVSGDRERMALVLSRRAHHFWSVGECRAGLEAGRKALSIATELDSLPLKASASYFLGQLHHAMGDYRAAIAILEQAVGLVPGALAFERLGMSAPVSIFARTWLAFSRAATGDFSGALSAAAEALRVAEALDHPYGLYHGHLALGAVHCLKGDVALAVPALERAFRISRESNMPAMGRPTVSHLGTAYALAGRLDEARAVLEEGLGEAAIFRWNSFLPLNVLALGHAQLLAGRLEEAEEAVTRALALSREHEHRGDEASTLWLHGEIAARRDPAAAEDRYAAALALAEELGMRPLAAMCHLGLGRLHRRAGAGERAAGELAVAFRLFREMDMGFWLEQAEAELRP